MVADALFAGSHHKQVQLHINKGLAGAPPAALAAIQQTAPIPRSWVPVKDAREIDLAAAELRRIVPNAGSYVSESNYFNHSWQDA